MMHTLEWSRAYTGRLQRDAAAVFAARAPELSRVWPGWVDAAGESRVCHACSYKIVRSTGKM